MYKKKKKNKGFTLIEIIIVVIIIGILASNALPQYTKLIERARMTEAKATLSAIFTAQKIYYAEYDNYSTSLVGLSIITNTNSKFTYTATDTVASAVRVGGYYAGKTLTLTYATNAWSGTYDANML